MNGSLASGKNRAQKRTQTSLSPKLDKRLLAYTAAASAAGVGLLAFSQAAEGKIVYTAANLSIPTNVGWVPVDINNDGIADFALYNYAYGPSRFPLGFHVSALDVEAAHSLNGVWMVESKNEACAAALPKNVAIGPKAPFVGVALGMFDLAGSYTVTSAQGFCPWKQQRRGAFLGLKFVVNGETHFGWAHVTRNGTSVVVNGYAYETVPNQPIHTGQTSGPAVISESLSITIPTQPASLDLLAHGSQALDIWRKSEKELEN